MTVGVGRRTSRPSESVFPRSGAICNSVMTNLERSKGGEIPGIYVMIRQNIRQAVS